MRLQALAMLCLDASLSTKFLLLCVMKGCNPAYVRLASDVPVD